MIRRDRATHGPRGTSLLLSATLTVLLVVGMGGGALAGLDPLRSKQWGLNQMRAGQAWQTSTGAGVVIAIVDTGISLTHPDLASKIQSAYTCIGTCRPGGLDDNGHGTHVAGIAAAITGNGLGVAGVAPGARLMAVKVLDADGAGSSGDIAMGIQWAVDHGARVVNLSLGPEIPLLLDLLDLSGLKSAVSYAWAKGAVVVAAAGNNSMPSFYTGTSGLLTVGATGPSDRVASYSSSGIGVNIFAPGGDAENAVCSETTCIVSTWKDAKYAAIEGTSMATPHVSGLAALLLAQGVTNIEVVSRIESTADTTPDGFRRVDAAKAVGAPPAIKTPAPRRSSGGNTSSPAKPSVLGTTYSAGHTNISIPSASPSSSKVPSPKSVEATREPSGSPTLTTTLASPDSRSTRSVPWWIEVVAAALVALTGGGVAAARRGRATP